MKMKCPHCGVSGKADESLAGCRVKCPKCTEIFLVPDVGNGVQPGHDTAHEVGEEADLENPAEQSFLADETVEEQTHFFSDQGEIELQEELDAMLAQTCSVCGKGVNSENTFTVNQILYCRSCGPDGEAEEDASTPSEGIEIVDETTSLATDADDGNKEKKIEETSPSSFGNLLKKMKFW